MLNDFMLSIANGTAPSGTVVDGGAAGSIGGGTAPYATLLDKSGETGTAPKAYLNFIVFDRDFNPILGQSGFIRLTEAAKENGTDVPHERISRPEPLLIKQPGYVYIYLSNENETPVEVFFDDFKVEHVKSPVVQSDDYYPFGLTFNSYSRENSVGQDYLYNGKEKQDELNLGWYDFGARMFMPDIGRWSVIDPMSELGRRWSPYTYAFNNPIRYIDPDGMWPWPSKSQVVSFLTGAANAILTNHHPTQAGRGTGRSTVTDQASYDAGQTAGDIISVVTGVVETVAGGTTTVAAVAETVLTGGAATPVTIVQGTAGVVLAAEGLNTANNGIKGLLNSNSNNQGSGQGRGKNNREPDPAATGDHTVSNDRGSTTYEVNEQNPTGFQEVKRVDTQGATHNNVPTPHVHQKVDPNTGQKIPGGVRPARPDEIPKTDLSKN